MCVCVRNAVYKLAVSATVQINLAKKKKKEKNRLQIFENPQIRIVFNER